MRNNGRIGRGFVPLPRFALLASLTLPLAACDIDELLTIQDPDIVDPSVFTDSTPAMNAFRNSAIGDFSLAFDGGGGDNQLDYSAMLADEFINSETFDTRIQFDIRKIEETNSNLQGVTRSLYRARTTIENGIRTFQRFSPGNGGTDPGNVRRAELFGLDAAVYMMFGEHYCSGVPFSRFNSEGEFEYGGQETTQQIFTRALQAADSAISIASRAPTTAAQTSYLNLGRVMRGRALLNLGRYNEAAEAVAAVPTTFSYVITHSENSGRENNTVFTFGNLGERLSVANREGTNGLPYRDSFAAGDPRVPNVRTPANDNGFDAITPQFDQLKYNFRTSSTPLATGIEARLIRAEAELAAGASGTALATLNALRATPPQIFYNSAPPLGTVQNTPAPLAALTAATTPAAQVNQLFQERAYWLWLTAHRLGDMRRLVRQYGRAQDAVFPTGAYHKAVQGGRYGSDVNFPVSVDERGNPEFADFPSNVSLCLNRAA